MILCLVAALALVVVNSESIVKTTTVTTTVIPAQQAVEMVDGSFSQHMLLLGSGNISAIVSEYETNASVTWNGKAQGWDGFFNGSFYIGQVMTNFLVKTYRAMVIGNVTTTTLAEANGSVVVNSKFGFASQGSSVDCILNGTVSAEDLYVYSAKSSAWLISDEAWDFLNFNYTPGLNSTPGYSCSGTH